MSGKLRSLTGTFPHQPAGEADRRGRVKRALAVALLTAGLLAGCSTSASPPTTTRSLAQDQKAVNDAQAAVNDDHSRLLADAQSDDGLGQIMCNDPTVTPRCPNNQYVSTTTQDEAKLKNDQFNLQVAQDQLTKDEG